MTISELQNDPRIQVLMEQAPAGSMEEIHGLIAGLKENGASLMQCIFLLSTKTRCGIGQAKEYVLDSPSWNHEKQAFIEFNNAFWDSAEEAADEVIINSDGSRSLLFHDEEDAP